MKDDIFEYVENYFGLRDVNENHKINTDIGDIVNLLYMFNEKTNKNLTA